MLTKKERKSLSHVERIHESVKRYIEQLDRDGTLEVIVSKPVEAEDTTQYMDMDEWSTTYTHIDANGDLIVEEAGDDNNGDADDISNVEELLPVEERCVRNPDVLYLMDECVIDLTNLKTAEEQEAVNQGVQKLTIPDGYYTVVYVIGNKTMRTPLRINYLEDEVNAVFDEVRNRKITEVI
jgi:hypothetical protein